MDLGYLGRRFGMPFQHDLQVGRETKGKKIDLGKVMRGGLFGALGNGTSVNGFGDCYRLSSAGRHRNGCRVRFGGSAEYFPVVLEKNQNKSTCQSTTPRRDTCQPLCS